ncbi:MAG: hypothetical protein GY801_47830 [bacterium]|nr:hypothetical protein [bacterium]
MLKNFITALHAIGIHPSAEELADTLWFAQYATPLKTAQDVLPSQEEQPPSHVPQPPLKGSSEGGSEGQAKPPQNLGDQTSEGSKTLNEKPQEDGLLFPKAEKTDSSRKIHGQTVRVPAATMLPNSLELERALRPLMRKIGSLTQKVIDEEQTVHRIAEEGIWHPVLKEKQERWLELALIIDRTASMLIWQPIVAELQGLLERHGAFRDVRVWTLGSDADNGAPVQLYAGSGNSGKHSRMCDPRELLEPSGRRVMLLVSDCISSAWYTNKLISLLELWGQDHPLAILQLLPMRLWAGTGLREAYQTSYTLPKQAWQMLV